MKGLWGYIEILCFKSYGWILDCVDCGIGKLNKCCGFVLVYLSNKNWLDFKYFFLLLFCLGLFLVFYYFLWFWLFLKEMLEMDIVVSKIKMNYWNYECSLNILLFCKYKVNLLFMSVFWFYVFFILWFSRICCFFVFN